MRFLRSPEIMEYALIEAEQLQQSYLMLLMNQSEANAGISRVVDTVVEVIMMVCSWYVKSSAPKLQMESVSLEITFVIVNISQ